MSDAIERLAATIGNEPEMMRSCIEADMEWIDGDCVKPERKGTD